MISGFFPSRNIAASCWPFLGMHNGGNNYCAFELGLQQAGRV